MRTRSGSRWAWLRAGLLAIGLAVVGVAATQAAAAETAGEARVRADLERYLRRGAESPRATIELPPLTRFAVEAGSFEGALRTELSTRAEPPFAGRVSITVELHAGDQLLRRGVVSPTVRVIEKVVAPARNLRRGDVVGPEDLQIVERDRTRLPPDALRDPAEIVGLRLKRSVRENTVLRISHVERVPIVERGDRVAIVLETGPLQIRSIGKAQEPGAVGDWIRVVNLDSRRELSGRVDREGRVHVAF